MLDFYYGKKNVLSVDKENGLELRKLIHGDIETIKKWLGERELAYIAFGLVKDIPESDLRPFIDNYIKFMSNPFSPCFFVAVCDLDSHLIALAKFDLRRVNGRLIALVGIIIGEKQNRSRGIGTKALRQLYRLLFDSYKVDMIEIETAVYNLPAYRCFKRLGMKKCDKLMSLEGIDGYGKPGFDAPKINMYLTRDDYYKSLSANCG
ncbi:GNAT family N-acetyltransferase [bacterium]|nr:GNAT family N-acetyltransferase [bacterium]